MFDTRLYSIIAETSTLASAKYSFKNSVLFTFLYFNSVLQNSLGFLLDFLYSAYLPSFKIISISISGAVITFITSILGAYALLNLNFSRRESSILSTVIFSSKPFLK